MGSFLFSILFCGALESPDAYGLLSGINNFVLGFIWLFRVIKEKNQEISIAHNRTSAKHNWPWRFHKRWKGCWVHWEEKPSQLSGEAVFTSTNFLKLIEDWLLHPNSDPKHAFSINISLLPNQEDSLRCIHTFLVEITILFIS